MKIALISCGKHKRWGYYKAKDLYTSPRFRLAYKEAKLVSNKIFVLSGKHGLLDSEKRIFTYDVSLRDLPPEVYAAWIENVLARIRDEVQKGEEIHFFCEPFYIRGIMGALQRDYVCIEHNP